MWRKKGTAEDWNMLHVCQPICQMREFPEKRDTREALILSVVRPALLATFLLCTRRQHTHVTHIIYSPPSRAPLDSGGLKEQCSKLRVLLNCHSHHHCYYGSVIQKCSRLLVTAWSIMKMTFPCFVLWTLKTSLAHQMSSGCHANYITF